MHVAQENSQNFYIWKSEALRVVATGARGARSAVAPMNRPASYCVLVLFPLLSTPFFLERLRAAVPTSDGVVFASVVLTDLIVAKSMLFDLGIGVGGAAFALAAHLLSTLQVMRLMNMATFIPPGVMAYFPLCELLLYAFFVVLGVPKLAEMTAVRAAATREAAANAQIRRRPSSDDDESSDDEGGNHAPNQYTKTDLRAYDKSGIIQQTASGY